MNDPHARKCWECGHVFTCRDGVLPECACRECGSHDTRRQKSQAEKDAEAATASAEARIKTCLAACDGMATEQLTPGCVAQLYSEFSSFITTVEEAAKTARVELSSLVANPVQPDWMPALTGGRHADAECLSTAHDATESMLRAAFMAKTRLDAMKMGVRVG